MSKRIYIGNLPWSVTKVRLEELFKCFGSIEDALVIANKYTGRSRGFGFVTFKEDADAEKAISEMDGKDVEGRALVVKEARPPKEEGVGEKNAGEEKTEKEEEPVEKEEKKE